MWKSLLIACSLLAAPLAAQDKVERQGLGREWADLGRAASLLTLDLSAGGVAIRPSEDGHVRVRASGKRERDLSRVRLRFETSGGSSELRVRQTPKNNFEMEIQIPRAVGLTLRMTAGEASIRGIEGDKDLRLHAGELQVQVGDPAAYRQVSASVWAGEIEAGPFGQGRDGLFRTFRYEGKGPFTLLAKVKAGQITFSR